MDSCNNAEILFLQENWSALVLDIEINKILLAKYYQRLS